jgi:hypothetical protein
MFCFSPRPGRIPGRDEERLGNHANLGRRGVDCQLLPLFHALVCRASSFSCVSSDIGTLGNSGATLIFHDFSIVFFYPSCFFSPDAGCTQRRSGKVAERFQEVVKKNQTRMNDELPPVILQSFKYHDKVDLSGFTVVSSTKFQKGTVVNESNIT